MRKVVLLVAALFMLTSLVAGCVSSRGGAIQIDPTLHSVSKDDFLDDDKAVELPANYSQRNYKRLVVGVYFFPQKDSDHYDSVPVETVSTTLETEISKLKRFTIVSRHGGQKAKMAEKRFQDLGLTDASTRMRFGHGLNADYTLFGGVTTAREEYERVDHNESVFIVRVDYQLIDVETDEIIEADYVEGRAKRTFVRLPSGKILGGFDMEKGTKDALNQASINALKVLGNRLGNKLPIGAQVVGIRGSRFGLDRGKEEGFMGKQTVILYTEDMGVDVPLAVGEVSPGAHKCSGKIIKWNEDSELQSLIEEVKKNPTFLARHEVFAVSAGMPLPPEWEKNYKD
ncbi:hypothetical protein [Desulfobaculum bizertense]|uniref:Peptidoglycan-synthase activator LpoB n=1 Tax=Desulfobaculum bizertense DSM 18034 TaxID=1121442 RepID=A0A1T4VRS0_9BACT|nr:hypothetical protein [Desulfobaculum bizertense]UIJ38342.1 hypothetical protein LWC08_01895 [Desulfobaculum bizertense]SKA67558.1 Peptidoglycan-synthase activator LpoB [Desulfobaculum bizertense DSM 18034]